MSYTNVKDKDEPKDRQGAVYKIKCYDCQASYIGETGRNLSTRLTEHKWATKNGDVNNHIAEHHLKTKHQIDWDSATCIMYSTDYYQRLTLESWFTNLEQTPLNHSQQLPAPYKQLSDEVKQNCGRAWQLKCPSTAKECLCNARRFTRWGGGGMLGGVGSPKIDWYIIVALLLIQALVEDQVHHPNDLGAQAIAITDNEDQEPIHSPIQITAVFNLLPVCSTPEGKM